MRMVTQVCPREDESYLMEEHCSILSTDMLGSGKDESEADGYYPGIVNISGTYCFMDSTLQVNSLSIQLSPCSLN